jgi:hypothetical protein
MYATEPEGLADAVTGSSTQHNLVLQPILPTAASAANLQQKSRTGCIQSLDFGWD